MLQNSTLNVYIKFPTTNLNKQKHYYNSSKYNKLEGKTATRVKYLLCRSKHGEQCCCNASPTVFTLKGWQDTSSKCFPQLNNPYIQSRPGTPEKYSIENAYMTDLQEVWDVLRAKLKVWIRQKEKEKKVKQKRKKKRESCYFFPPVLYTLANIWNFSSWKT